MEHQPPHPVAGPGAKLIGVAADTIVAAATPAGRGGIGIVRLSGPAVVDIALALLGQLPAPRHAQRSRFCAADGTAIDEGLALYFPKPHSFTGEDVLELHGHGGPLVLQTLQSRAQELGARAALPGEFTQRAYLNGKLDLAQAEAIADLIDAGSQAAARAALRSLQGEFSRHVHALAEQLAELRAYVEAAIDFPEEEIDFLADVALTERLSQVQRGFVSLEAKAQQGRLLTEGMSVVIAGAPNAGKSTLLNTLAGYEAAIVTDVPGTTRDVLRERIHIAGMPIHLLDTAGLRVTSDVIEAEGVRRAHAEMQRADHILFLVDSAADAPAHSFLAARRLLPAHVPVTVIFNKADLTRAALPELGVVSMHLSALTGEGIEALRERLAQSMGFATNDHGALSARARHVRALALAHRHVDEAEAQLRSRRAGELVAEELRLAQHTLGEITGQVSSEELLGRIFASFCIGK